MRTRGFVIDEVAELQRRIPLSPQKGSRKASFLCNVGMRTCGFVIKSLEAGNVCYNSAGKSDKVSRCNLYLKTTHSCADIDGFKR